MKKVRNTTPSVEKQGRKKFWMKQLLMPQILAAAMLLGMFHWTKLLGFRYLLCCDRRNGSVYEYYLP